MPLHLRPYLSFCRVGDRFIFLDVAADRYFCLNAMLDAAIGRLIDRETDGADDPGVKGLLARGLLVDSPEGSAIRPCAAPAEPTASLLDRGTVADALSTGAALLGLWASIAQVRYRPLVDNVAAIGRRHRVSNTTGTSDDLARIAAAFDTASTWTSSHDRCLPQSLAVARTALARGHDVQAIIGVSLGPFLAHCWVQHGPVVVNDRVDMVRRFTPILVI